jgi:myo-inositol-1(or 4)-monophosphatase
MADVLELPRGELLRVAREAAAAGAAVASAWERRREELVFSEKAASDDLVSQADLDAERAILAVLRRLRPEDGVEGEETGRGGGASGIRWVVDPIDGTTNYRYGRADWAVSVAAIDERDGGRLLAAAVAEPAIGRTSVATLGWGAWADGKPLRCNRAADLSRALVEVNFGRGGQRQRASALVEQLHPRVRDLRRGGSAAAALAQVASGRADAYWGPGLQPWDGSAGALLVQEAGGTVGDLGGSSAGSWPASGDILAAAPGLWEPLRKILLGVYSEDPVVSCSSGPGRGTEQP